MSRTNQILDSVRREFHINIRLVNESGVPEDAPNDDINAGDRLHPGKAPSLELLKSRKADRPVIVADGPNTLWAVIPWPKGYTLLAGPMRCPPCANQASTTCSVESEQLDTGDERAPELSFDAMLECILRLYLACHEEQDHQIVPSDMDGRDDAITGAYSIIYDLRENDSSHNSYAQEVREQKAVREGDIPGLRQSWTEVQSDRFGRLGRDEVTHTRNLAIVVVTLSSRSAIEGGTLPEIAYSLADSYTMRISEMTDPDEIILMARRAELHFARLVHDVQAGSKMNRYVVRCKELIHDKLHQRIQVSDLAEELGVSRNYLSQVFLKEEGMRLSAYILRAKIRSAEQMLIRTEMPIEQIAATFAFTSQSHFGQTFKRFTGMTPSQFRALHSSHR